MVSLRPLAALPVVGVVADGRTYRHLLYLVIAVPLMVAYSGFVSFALVFGILFSVVLVGIGVLVAAVIGSRLVAGLERWLANRLLGTDLVAPDDLPAAADDGSAGATATVRAYLSAPSTWRGLGFVSLKFWVAAVAFAPLFVLASALPLVPAPLRYPYAPQFGELNGEPLVWSVDTVPEAALATGLGVVGVLIGLHLTNLIAGGARLMAVALLGGGSESDDGARSGSDGDPVTVDRDAAGGERDAVAGEEDAEGTGTSRTGSGDDLDDRGASGDDDDFGDTDESGDTDDSAVDGFEFGDADPVDPDGPDAPGDARGDRD